MENKLNTFKLVDICSVIKRGISPKYTESNGIPVINQRCIRNYKVSFDNARLNDLNKKKIPEDRVLQDYDVLINSTGVGTLGRVAQIAKVDEKLTVDSHVTIVRLDHPNIDKRFFGWVLKCRQPIFESLGEGSTGQTELSRHLVGDVSIDIPSDKSIQIEIADTLDAIDNKIGLNLDSNQTLEKMAQALFKSWFVDFDPVFDNALASGIAVIDFPEALQKKAAQRLQVQQQMANEEPSASKKPSAHKQPLADKKAEAKPLPQAANASEQWHQLFPSEFEQTDEPSIGINGWIPKGWKLSSFESLIKLIGGGTPKTTVEEYWNGDIPWFSVVDAPNDSDVFVLDTEKHVTQLGVDKSSTKILRSGTTIISARGTVGKCALVAGPMAMNQSCYGINGIDGISDEFIYFMTRHQVSDLQKRGHGSVFNTITRETFKSILLPCSGGEVTQKFSEVVSPFLNKALLNNKQNVELIKTRDVLLPKLISGELTLPADHSKTKA